MSSLRAVAPFLVTAFVIGSCVSGPLPPSATGPLPSETLALAGTVPTAPVSPTPSSSNLAPTSVGSALQVCSKPTPIGLGKLELAFVANWDGDREVYVVTADGSNLAQLTNNTSGDVGPAWSPDGQQIAFVVDAYTNPRLFIARAEGPDGRVLRPDFEISSLGAEWSPDGAIVAFRNMEDLYVMSASTGELSLLTGAADTVPGKPMFSPDGSVVGFVADVRGHEAGDALFVVNTDGTDLREVGFLEGHSILRAAWRPHQDQILLETTSAIEGTALYLAGLDGTFAKLSIGSDSFAPEPGWSPDGNMIGYILRADVFDSKGQLTTRDSLHVATPDGEVDVEVVAPAGDAGTPFPIAELIWAPDGRRIAYSMHAEGDVLDLFVVDICDGTSSVVARGIDLFSTPSWRPLP